MQVSSLKHKTQKPRVVHTTQKTLNGSYVSSLPKVRTTDGHLMDWNRDAIVNQLLKETKLSEVFYEAPSITEEEAKEIARETEKRIKDMNVRFLSGPLVRELVNIILLEKGHVEWRNISTRVGTPVYDAFRIDMGTGFEAKDNANLQENAETSHKKKADKMSKEQYLLMLPPRLADAHLNGDIHIHDLEYFGTRAFCQDWDLRYFFYYGLMPDGNGTKASVAGPAKKPEVAVLHAVKALGSAQTNFSVAGNEDVLIKDDKETKIVKIGELVDKLMKGKKTVPIPEVNGEMIDVHDLNLKACAFNPRTLRMEYRTINKVIRHPSPDKLYEIVTESGRKVLVTGAHSLFTLSEGEIKIIEASKLRQGDYVVVPKKLPASNVVKDINLVSELTKLPDELISDIYVIGITNGITDQIHNRDRDSVPLWYIKHHEIEVNEAKLRISHSFEIPAKIRITPNFARLLGYFAAKGHITWDTSKNIYFVVFSFGSHEIKEIEDTKQCIKEIFGIDADVQRPHSSEVQVIVRSKLLALIYKEVIKTGTNSKNKRIPIIIFNTVEENKLEFLSGYYCDDNTHRRGIIYKTVTKKLASDLLYLLLQLGIAGQQEKVDSEGIIPSTSYQTNVYNSIRKITEHLSLSINNFEYKTVTKSPVAIPLNHAGIHQLVEDVKPAKTIPELNIHNKKHFSPQQVKKLVACLRTIVKLTENDKERIEKIANGDLGFDIVKWIRHVKSPTKYVYDLSIEGYENFTGGHGGIILHNSGGQGFYNFLTFIAPYFENLSYEEIEQLMQMFVYEMTQMMVARGGQLVFSSVQLSPGVPKLWRDKPVVYKGKVWDGKQAPLRKYGEFEREVRLAFEALMNVMLKGDYWGKPFNFPKPEISIEPDFMQEDEEFHHRYPDILSYDELYTKAFELAARYGVPYFDNQLPEYRGAGKGISCYQCLPGDELIPIIRDGTAKVDNIARIFEEAARKGIEVDINGVEFVQLDALTPTMEFGRFKAVPQAFKGIMRKRYKGKILNIVLESGRRIKVTPDHPLFVCTKGGFEKKIARNLKHGEYLPVIKNDCFQEKIRAGDYIDIEEILQNNNENVVRDNIVNTTHAKNQGFLKKLCITPELIRFLGYYLAEGCCDSSKHRYSVRLSFSKNEVHLVEDAKHCIRAAFGIDPVISEEETTNVIVNSKPLYQLLDALGCGHNAHDKSIPDLMFNVEKHLVNEYLKVVFREDRNIDCDVSTANNASIIHLKLISREAVQKLVLLAQRINIQMNYHEEKQTITHPQTKEVHTFRAFIAPSQYQTQKFSELTECGESIFTCIPIQETGIDDNIAYPSQYHSQVSIELIYKESIPINIKSLIEGDIHLLRVKTVEESYYDGYVYDLVDVGDAHNFCNVFGIVISNCCAYQFSSTHENDPEFEDKLYFRNGKHFSMGAWQVISLNCPRAAYRANKDDERLFSELKRMMDICVELFKIKRKWMDIVINNNRMPFVMQRPKDPITFKRGEVAVDISGLVYTIGVVGINEMVQYHTGKQMHESEDARRLAIRAMYEMKFYAKELSKKHGMNIVLARTPAETTAQRFAVSDLLHKEYRKCAEPIIKGDVKTALARIHASRDLPVYYTNGTHVPPGADISLSQRIRIEEVFFPIVDGGNILHIWLGEAAPHPEGLKELAMNIAKNTQVGYFAFTKDITLCKDDFHVASGLLSQCPNCGSSNVEHLSRVTGYIQAVSGWNEGKKQELIDRKRYAVDRGGIE